MENLKLVELNKLKQVMDVIEVFRTLDPNINILTVQAILDVARKGDRGSTVKGLEKFLGCSAAAASRNLYGLEASNERNPKGHGLAKAEVDPMDPKGKLRKPTDAMQNFIAKVLHALD